MENFTPEHVSSCFTKNTSRESGNCGWAYDSGESPVASFNLHFMVLEGTRMGSVLEAVQHNNQGLAGL